MDTQFWHDKWQTAQIGFHLSEVHPMLHRHGALLEGRRKVFVPLCGKTLDLLCLRDQGAEVVGVELSPIAIGQFFAEHGLTPASTRLASGECFEIDAIRLICADFFSVCREELGEVDAVYDRAALIAMPPAMQEAYARQLRALIPAHAVILLITLDYDPSEMEGPPFSTPADQVRRLFGDRYEIRELERRDVLATNPALKSRGLSALTETAWYLTPV